MSGSSLDGLDVAYCHFWKNDGQWKFEIKETHCYPLGADWEKRLQELPTCSAKTYLQAHADFGRLTGELIKDFVQANRIEPDLLVSHGHTIFHEPNLGYTGQIGDGATIAATTNIDTLSDLRMLDIARGGQGAPIVPVGDTHLFADYKYCLNLGGIANISIKSKNGILASDLSGCNQLLNFIAQKLGKPYDDEGLFARSGKVNEYLLAKINDADFYRQAFPKSLSNDWVRNNPMRILSASSLKPKDVLATACEHIAIQIAAAIDKENVGNAKILATGGGAFNKYLLERIQAVSNVEVITPSADLIAYKEALVMAFIGALYLNNEMTAFASVTGAKSNSILGALHKSKSA